MKKGLVHMYHGNGKGKTTAVMGLSVRALGHDNKVIICQFLKSCKTGEEIGLNKLGVTILKDRSNPKFSWNMNAQEKSEYKKTQNILLDELKNNIGKFDLIVLDEVLDAVNSGIITESEIIDIIKNKEEHQEFALTGRNPSEKLKEICDYVTFVQAQKHPYMKGIPARKGIEF